jgi:hypothetical protein
MAQNATNVCCSTPTMRWLSVKMQRKFFGMNLDVTSR